MKRIIAIAVMTIAAASCSGKKIKPVRIGLINFVSGSVFVLAKDGAETPARVGLPVDMGMKIRVVGKNSLCEIYFNENVVKIFGDSLVEIETLYHNMQTGTDETALALRRGRMFINIADKMMKKEHFDVRTATCTAAVRGTEFFVTESGSAANVACLDGKVEVTHAKQKKSVVIGAREGAKTSPKSIANADIDDKRVERLEKDSAVKPVTEKNKATFERIEEKDPETMSWLRKTLRRMSSSSEISKEEDKSTIDTIFFRSND